MLPYPVSEQKATLMIVWEVGLIGPQSRRCKAGPNKRGRRKWH